MKKIFLFLVLGIALSVPARAVETDDLLKVDDIWFQSYMEDVASETQHYELSVLHFLIDDYHKAVKRKENISLWLERHQPLFKLIGLSIENKEQLRNSFKPDQVELIEKAFKARSEGKAADMAEKVLDKIGDYLRSLK